MNDFVTSYIGQMKNLGSLNYKDLPNNGTSMGEAGWPFSQEAFLESDAWFEVRVLAIKAEVRHLHYKKEKSHLLGSTHPVMPSHQNQL